MLAKLLRPDIAGALNPGGMDVTYRPPADQTSFAAGEMQRCRDVVQLSGVKLD